MTRRLLAVMLMLPVLAACGYTEVPEDKTGVHVEGAITHRQAPTITEDCLKPGTAPHIGYGDDPRLFPSGQRTYKIGTGEGQDMPAVKVITSNKVTMRLTGVVSFYLNTDCKVLRRFAREIGFKDWGGAPAYVNTSDGDDFTGWRNMLDVYLGEQAKNVINDVAGGKTSEDLIDPTIRRQLQAPIEDALPKAVRSFAHGPYFTRFTVRLNQPVAPAALTAAYNAKEAAIRQNEAQAAKNTKALTQLDQLKACKRAGLAESTCAFIYAVNTGAVTAIPQGSAVTVP